MRSSRIFKTASFKLAAAYAIMFSASVAILAAIVYLTATATLDHQERARIQAEAHVLKAEYDRAGLRKMLDEIGARTRWHLAGGLGYAVIALPDTRIYSDIPQLKLRKGWMRAKGPPDGDEPPGHREHLLAYSAELRPGLWLQVVDDVERAKAFEKVIMDTFAWFLAVIITLAIIGGIIMSVSVLARIDTITRTAEAIIEGDLDRRVPLRGVADDIDRLASTLNRMLNRISLLLGVVRQVSRHIAHDLRTPLGRLRQSLEDARTKAKCTSDYERAINRALAETDEILATFAALLRIAQIESGTRRAGFQPVDLSALALHIADSYTPVAEDAGKKLTVSIMPDVYIVGDRELLIQLLVNLIENAIRHTRHGSQILVEVLGGRRPALVVSDNGPGMSEDERKRIEYRPNRREGATGMEGHGLGLTLVAAITELHDAEIKLSDCRPGLAVCMAFASITDSAAETGASTHARWRFAPQLGRLMRGPRVQHRATHPVMNRPPTYS
jgi:signal transduction histidine kinase